jgi:hypothetical protein
MEQDQKEKDQEQEEEWENAVKEVDRIKVKARNS